jgi:hypothetical protein
MYLPASLGGASGTRRARRHAAGTPGPSACADGAESDDGLPHHLSNRALQNLPRLLGSLGYPAFAYLAAHRTVANPAAVVLASLRATKTAGRVTEALPWVLVRFPDLDWEWLLAALESADDASR